MDVSEIERQTSEWDARVKTASGNRKDQHYQISWGPDLAIGEKYPRKDFVRVYAGKVWAKSPGYDLVAYGEVWDNATDRLESGGHKVAFVQDCIIPDDFEPLGNL
jgi:hypothetical protein